MDNASLVVFSNEEFGKVRTVGTPDDPKFCLADVCRSLELRVDGVVARLKEDPITAGVLSQSPVQTAGGIQQMYFVNEDGLYDVILDSRKPAAKKFRKWITSEVLPSIRKTGSYSAQVPAQEQLFKFMDKLGSVNDPGAQLALIDMFRATIQNTQPNLANPDTITMEDLFYGYVIPTPVIKRIPKGNGRNGHSITALYQYVCQDFRDAIVRPSSGSSGIHRSECLVSRDRVEDIIKSLIEYNTSDLNAQL